MTALAYSLEKNSGGDAIHPNPEIALRLKKIYSLSRRDMNFELSAKSPYAELLERLGNPHLKLPPVIHVAGTNGKGSTLAMFRSIFEAAGLTAHVYTSPHLTYFNERIVCGSSQIDDDTLLRYLKMVDEINADNPVTFFEYTTALAFKVFADYSADICLLEVGLGGRLDCTNIIEEAILSVITQIGYDHTEFLGDTLPKIAAEKAGIIKPDSKVVIAQQSYKEAQDFLQQFVAAKSNEYAVADQGYPSYLPVPNLTGPHQLINAQTVLKGLDMIKDLFEFSKEQIAQGMTQIKWPARMQDISMHLPTKEEQFVWLDSGHNEAAAICLADHVKSWNDKRVLILGMQKSKDSSRFLQPLLPFFDVVYAVDNINANFPQSAEELASFIKEKTDIDVVVGHNVAATLDNVLAENTGPLNVLIAGSVYLAGEVMKAFSIKT